MFREPKFLLSCGHWRQWPPNRKEPIIAFWGRSNVGKSSLINLLTQSKIAHVSKTPGRTRLLNVFETPHPATLICDLPGYGYAEMSKTESLDVATRLEQYLRSPHQPHLLCWLVDLRHGLLKSDLAIAPLMQEFSQHRDLLVIGTKCDKLSKSDKAKAISLLENQLSMLGCNSDLFIPVSALTKEGVENLREVLSQFTQSYYAQQSPTET